MQEYMKCYLVMTVISLSLLATTSQTHAQLTNDTPPSADEAETTSNNTPMPDRDLDDEVISRGTIVTGQHEGMDAFFRGDFETAEIEFENEFKSLRRFESARENAAGDAVISADRVEMQALAGNNLSSSVNSRSGGAPSQSAGSALSLNSGVTSNFISRRSEGRTILTDGEVTYEDFGFTRYMSGLSEIKLGKYSEASSSLTQSLRYDEFNYDARMRLGLLNIMDADFEAAADQLEKIDRQRRRCIRITCDDMDTLRQATVTLARELTKAVEAG